ncbi:MAG: addiction module protein [Gammaproteobacteria bacterium]|nr:addiction module protein [Gammaproteobacteria bacterium]
MAYSIPLESMSVEEKLQAMESIWEDLYKKSESISSPSWHKKILNEREEGIENGEEKFEDWETAKNNIKKDIS